MTERTRFEIRLAAPARADIESVLLWGLDQFGDAVALRYEALIHQALLDIAEDPHRSGARPRPEIMDGVFTYHLWHSRDRIRSSIGLVRRPRHLVVFRLRDRVVEIVRSLHDARDLARHMPA